MKEGFKPYAHYNISDEIYGNIEKTRSKSTTKIYINYVLLNIIGLCLAEENIPGNSFKKFHFPKLVSCKIICIIADY